MSDCLDLPLCQWYLPFDDASVTLPHDRKHMPDCVTFSVFATETSCQLDAFEALSVNVMHADYASGEV
jgi:hypothetical protein